MAKAANVIPLYLGVVSPNNSEKKLPHRNSTENQRFPPPCDISVSFTICKMGYPNLFGDYFAVTYIMDLVLHSDLKEDAP